MLICCRSTESFVDSRIYMKGPVVHTAPSDTVGLSGGIAVFDSDVFVWDSWILQTVATYVGGSFFTRSMGDDSLLTVAGDVVIFQMFRTAFTRLTVGGDLVIESYATLQEGNVVAFAESTVTVKGDFYYGGGSASTVTHSRAFVIDLVMYNSEVDIRGHRGFVGNQVNSSALIFYIFVTVVNSKMFIPNGSFKWPFDLRVIGTGILHVGGDLQIGGALAVNGDITVGGKTESLAQWPFSDFVIGAPSAYDQSERRSEPLWSRSESFCRPPLNLYLGQGASGFMTYATRCDATCVTLGATLEGGSALIRDDSQLTIIGSLWIADDISVFDKGRLTVAGQISTCRINVFNGSIVASGEIKTSVGIYKNLGGSVREFAKETKESDKTALGLEGLYNNIQCFIPTIESFPDRDHCLSPIVKKYFADAK